MDELILAAKAAHANTFVMYYKSHAYHWNVECKNFAEMHEFFNGLYDDLWNAVDPLAEEMRTLDVYAPISLTELYNYKTIPEDAVRPDSVQVMLANLSSANDQVIESLNRLFTACTAQNKQGFANFVAERLDKHEKHGWMIRSFLKGGE